MKSNFLISSWLRGVPTFKRGDCASPAAGAARMIADASKLSEHRIGYAPISSNLPRLDHVSVNGAYGLVHVLFGDAPVLVQLLLRGLDFTLIIGATGHDHGLFAVPSPIERKAG